jgi:hypothetical protein
MLATAIFHHFSGPGGAPFQRPIGAEIRDENGGLSNKSESQHWRNVIVGHALALGSVGLILVPSTHRPESQRQPE